MIRRNEAQDDVRQLRRPLAGLARFNVEPAPEGFGLRPLAQEAPPQQPGVEAQIQRAGAVQQAQQVAGGLVWGQNDPMQWANDLVVPAPIDQWADAPADPIDPIDWANPLGLGGIFGNNRR
jgi:hypothetical protein